MTVEAAEFLLQNVVVEVVDGSVGGGCVVGKVVRGTELQLSL
jgi:hypothetical protein